MTTWSYTGGHIEACNETGTLLCAIPAATMWAPLADLFNANQQLSRHLLAGFGHVEAGA